MGQLRLERGDLEDLLGLVTVFYPSGADLSEVQRLVREREPVNICMRRCYDEVKLQQFGYSRGAYGDSSAQRLLPNIAIYCKTPMRHQAERREVHVINVIGYAFDTSAQPDYQYFNKGKGSRCELVRRMSQMWEYVFFCAKEKGLKLVYLSNVGGGAFATHLPDDYARLKAESLGPVKKRYPEIQVKSLPRIPDSVSGLKEGLLVNAWDPWSMVGNGNAGDHSLDGFFGRSTAMALLCWPDTNPFLKYQAVQPPG